MVDFFNNLMQDESSINIDILKTHPNTEARIEEINKNAPNYYANCSKEIKFDMSKLKSIINFINS